MKIYVSKKTKEILEKRGTYDALINDAKGFTFSTEVVERILRRIDSTLLDEYNIRFLLPLEKIYDVRFCLDKKKSKI